jgi:hypothetical protein
MLDVEAIGSVELRTGGFGAQYGNRTTGVIEMTSASPEADGARSSVGLSLSNVRAKTEGRFAGGRGSWLASARRGYLDVILDLIDVQDAPDPTYYDLFGKVQRQIGTRHLLSGHALIGGDRLEFFEDDSESFVVSRYDNHYLWTALKSQISDGLSVTTLASYSHLTWKRDGRIADVFDTSQAGPRVVIETARIADDRFLDVIGVKQDWSWDATARLSLLAGGEFHHETSRLRYDRVQRDYNLVFEDGVLADTNLLDTAIVRASLPPDGNRMSGYGAVRARPWTRLTIETGIRADHHDWTGKTIVAPRVSAALDLSSRMTLRAAWGLYPQAHAIHDLSIVDGDTAFAPAERAEHRVVGVEHVLGRGWTLRTEAFDRVIRDPRARWINTDGDIEALPEAETDRLRLSPSDARVRGLEWLATYDRGGAVRASGSYVLSKGTQTQDGIETPRPFDERHALALDFARRSRGGWTWAFSFTMHSGWPFIPATFAPDTITTGPPANVVPERVPSAPVFTGQLSTYHRFDARISKAFDAGRHRISVFVDVFNLFDRDNESGSSYDAVINSGGTVTVRRFRELFLPRLPSLGVRWDF